MSDQVKSFDSAPGVTVIFLPSAASVARHGFRFFCCAHLHPRA
jgi:hypothetical protein